MSCRLECLVFLVSCVKEACLLVRVFHFLVFFNQARFLLSFKWTLWLVFVTQLKCCVLQFFPFSFGMFTCYYCTLNVSIDFASLSFAWIYFSLSLLIWIWNGPWRPVGQKSWFPDQPSRMIEKVTMTVRWHSVSSHNSYLMVHATVSLTSFVSCAHSSS